MGRLGRPIPPRPPPRLRWKKRIHLRDRVHQACLGRPRRPPVPHPGRPDHGVTSPRPPQQSSWQQQPQGARLLPAEAEAAPTQRCWMAAVGGGGTPPVSGRSQACPVPPELEQGRSMSRGRRTPVPGPGVWHCRVSTVRPTRTRHAETRRPRTPRPPQGRARRPSPHDGRASGAGSPGRMPRREAQQPQPHPVRCPCLLRQVSGPWARPWHGGRPPA